jgi:PAS domain S-box-containing protein
MDQPNILLVDDQPGKLLSYQAILAELGESLVLARSGREALQRLLKEEFALILLDVVMPDMDGFETAAMIRQRPSLVDTPIIFITAYDTSELDRLKGYQLGAVDFVFAPIVPEILRAKVSALAELYRKRRELLQANEQLRAEIVDRQRAEHELRQTEERFRLMVENVRDYGIFMLDPAGQVVTWNAGAERLNGYRADEIVGRHFSRFYPDQEVAEGKPALELRIADDDGRFEEEGWRLRKDGTRYWANVVITALRDPSGRLVGFAKLSHDLTERKRLQEQAMQNVRLAAIGQMVAGLAHESRNAMQQIQAAVEMLARRLPAEPEAGLVTEIQKANDRLHHLLEAVRNYAAPLKLTCEVHDLSRLWHEAWAQLAPLRHGLEVALHQNTAGLDLRCLVDPFTIEQLFRNVLENALMACRDQACGEQAARTFPRIDIACNPAELDGKPAIGVRIRDNGPGMNAEQKQRIFEPFFTSRTRGTGLGMAIARRIVEAHRGRIAVGRWPEAPGEGPGTEIEILLPKGMST